MAAIKKTFVGFNDLKLSFNSFVPYLHFQMVEVPPRLREVGLIYLLLHLLMVTLGGVWVRLGKHKAP